MVMADRGFTISVGLLKQAKLVIPAFTKGNSNWTQLVWKKTRGIASIRIHVERVIGLLQRKYTILEGTLPTDFLACNPHGSPYAQVPMIDHIVGVCAALVNVCPPILCHLTSFTDTDGCSELTSDYVWLIVMFGDINVLTRG